MCHNFKGSWDTHLSLDEFSNNNIYHTSIRCEPFEALYGRKCRSPVVWAKVDKSQMIGHEIVQETTDKIFQIKDRLKAARNRQKSYTGNHKKPLKFCVGDHVLLKVSPWKGVVCFGKNELSGVHDIFLISNHKKCLAYETLHVPLEEIRIDAKLHFIEELMEIMDWVVKKLKGSRIPIVKV
ncbi:putative reverse transcriptase domain-containing protein [Tanacetum coccineum]